MIPLEVLCTALLLAAPSPPSSPSRADAETKITALERRLKNRVGFAALNVATGHKIEHRAGERFAMCSVVKWLIAADVFAHASGPGATKLSLDKAVPYGESDLVGHAPTTRKHVRQGAMTIGALADAAVVVSDNTAANLLLPLVGGPKGLTEWLRSHGDATTRVDRNEPSLNTNIAGDPRDTTTPATMVFDLQKLVLGDALPAPARERLTADLEHCETGKARLRAGIPAGWRVADKTGTCARGAVNDIAVVWPPKGGPLVMAAFLSDREAPLEALEAAHAELARIAVEALAPGAKP